MARALAGMARQRYVSPYWYAVAHAGVGNRESALLWLEKGRQERDVWLTWLRVEPRFTSLGEHARFRGLCATLFS